MNNNLLSNRFTLMTAVALIVLAGSCSVFRPGTTSDPNGTSTTGSAARSPATNGGANGGRFLTTISTDNASGDSDPDAGSPARRTSVSRNDRNRGENSPLYRSRENKENTASGPATPLSVLQLKYSMLTNTPVDELGNQKLLEFMDEWYGVPYRFGGTTKKGIDCSAFTLTLMEDVYGLTSFPRVSRDQYEASEKISRKKLREGDLVFFHTYGKGKKVTHVGVYLYNNRFVHASTSGVQIDDLDGAYYSRHFVGAGRVLE